MFNATISDIYRYIRAHFFSRPDRMQCEYPSADFRKRFKSPFRLLKLKREAAFLPRLHKAAVNRALTVSRTLVEIGNCSHSRMLAKSRRELVGSRIQSNPPCLTEDAWRPPSLPLFLPPLTILLVCYSVLPPSPFSNLHREHYM